MYAEDARLIAMSVLHKECEPLFDAIQEASSRGLLLCKVKSDVLCTKHSEYLCSIGYKAQWQPHTKTFFIEW